MLKREHDLRSKGESTRAAIIDGAMLLISQLGFQSLTIGSLAQFMAMSKSGVFVHFGSREVLLVEVLRKFHKAFEEEVIYPCLHMPSGLARLEAIFKNWAKWTGAHKYCCAYAKEALQYAEESSIVYRELASIKKALHGMLHDCISNAVAAGELLSDTSARQFIFEMSGLIASHHHETHFQGCTDGLECAMEGFKRLAAYWEKGNSPPYEARAPRCIVKVEKSGNEPRPPRGR